MEVRPAYKQTDVGIIPEEWEVKPLGELGKFKNGINKAKEDFGYGFPLINLMDVFGIPRVSASTTEFGLVNSTTAERKLYELKGGDVLFVRSSVKPEGVGLTTLIPEDLPETVFSGFLIRFRDTGMLEHGFKEHCFSDERFRGRLVSNSTVSANTNINQDALKRLQLAFPPSLPEQRAIARTLSDVDRLLSALDQIIAKKRGLNQAAMQQLLTGQTRLPGFEGEWEVKPFSAVLVRLNAKAHQIQTSDYQSSGRYPVVDQGKESVIGFSDKEDMRLRCPEGGVIVFGDHTCVVKFIDFDFVVGADGTQILQGKTGQSTRFHALQLQYRGVESTGYNRHFKFIKEREFVTPSLPEQTAIAEVLTDMDAELAALEHRRQKIRALKRGMMQELLTGRTRLISTEAIDA